MVLVALATIDSGSIFRRREATQAKLTSPPGLEKPG